MISTRLVPTRHTLAALALLGLAAAPGAHAQTTFTGGVITPGVTAPTQNVIISQGDFSGTPSGSTDYTDNGNPGQSFTIGAAPVQLTGITFKNSGGAGNGFNGAGATFTLTIGSLYNYGYNYTAIDAFTYSSSALTGTGEYFTFDTTQANLVLAANTQYIAVVYSTNPGGTNSYYGMSESATDVYAGGIASVYSAGNHLGYDRTFYVQGVTPAAAAPEPSQSAAFGLGVLGLAGLALKARRRAA